MAVSKLHHVNFLLDHRFTCSCTYSIPPCSWSFLRGEQQTYHVIRNIKGPFEYTMNIKRCLHFWTEWMPQARTFILSACPSDTFLTTAPSFDHRMLHCSSFFLDGETHVGCAKCTTHSETSKVALGAQGKLPTTVKYHTDRALKDRVQRSNL